MNGDQWFGLAVGIITIAAVIAGLNYKAFGDVLSAIADRIRHGKQPRPDEHRVP